MSKEYANGNSGSAVTNMATSMDDLNSAYRRFTKLLLKEFKLTPSDADLLAGYVKEKIEPTVRRVAISEMIAIGQALGGMLTPTDKPKGKGRRSRQKPRT